MSSTTTTPGLGSSSLSVPATMSSSGMSNGTTYFFGFLVAFIVLLLLSVGLVLITRRRVLNRRSARLLTSPWIAPSHEGGGLREPKLLEPKFVSGGDSWKSIMPLSASVGYRECKGEVYEDQLPPYPSAPHHPVLLTATRTSSAPDRGTRSCKKGSSEIVNVDDGQAVVQSEPMEVRVSVVIAMPSSRHDRHPDTSRKFMPEEYEVGVAVEEMSRNRAAQIRR